MSDSEELTWRQRLAGEWRWLLPIAVFFVGMARWSWRKWPDILTDYGHQLYVPWRLSEGEVLYRDMYYIMGPVSQYFHAAMFRVFGVSLSTLIWVNLLLTAGVTLWLYWFFREVGSRLTGMVLAVLFVMVFAFSQYVGVANYTYICAYRYELPHGLMVCLVMVGLLAGYQRRPHLGWLVGTGICLALTGLLKSEILLAAAGTAVAGTGLLAWQERPPMARLVQGVGCVLAGGIAVVAAWWGYFALKMPLGEALSAVFTNVLISTNSEAMGDAPFYLAVAGFDMPGKRLGEMVVVALCWIAVAGVAAGVDRLAGSCPHRGKVYGSLLGVVLAGSGYFGLSQEAWFMVGRPLPLICLFGLVLAVLGVWRRRDDEAVFRRGLLLGMWSVLAGLLLLKMVLRVRLDFYGFVLAMPAMMLAGWLVLHWLPEQLGTRGGTGLVVRGAMLGVLVGMVAVYVARSAEFYDAKTVAIGEGGDLFWHDPMASPRHQLLPTFEGYLRERLPRGATLTVMPQMGVFNYQQRRRDPVKVHTFTPWEIVAYGGEAKILAEMQAEPPDAVVLMSINMREDGKAYFGLEEGYGDLIMTWVKSTYEVDKVLTMEAGQVARDFHIVVFVRSGLVRE